MSAQDNGIAEDLLSKIPQDLTVREAMNDLCNRNAWVWTARRRKLKGSYAVFNIVKTLEAMKRTTPIELKKELIKHRPFLIQPLADEHPHKAYQKGRQVGVSEVSISEVMAFLDTHPNSKWIYTFPRMAQLQDFSSTRINTMKEESAAMRRIFGVPDQVFTKRIGNSFLLLRSAWESNLGEGVDADGLTLDEKDRMKDGIEIAFKESLQSSAYGYIREVSTPSLPGRGINMVYQPSDQHEWFVRCRKCGLKQTVEYPDNVVQMKEVPLGCSDIPEGSYDYRCKITSCRGELDRWRGEWVAKFPDRKHIRGYFIPQTIAPWQNATSLMQKLIDYKFKQLWENYALGRTAVGESQLLNELDFEAISTDYVLLTYRTGDWKKVVVGIDWGYKNWVTVFGLNANGRVYLIGLACFEDSAVELNSVKAVENYIRPFNPDMIMADAGYGKDRNAYLLRRFGVDKVYVCNYNSSPRASKSFTTSWVYQSNKVIVDRTMSLKTTCRLIKDQEVGCPRDNSHPLVGLWKRHLLNLAPLRQEENGEIYELIDKIGDDHLAHCTNYCMMALDQMTNEGGQFQFSFLDDTGT